MGRVWPNSLSLSPSLSLGCVCTWRQEYGILSLYYGCKASRPGSRWIGRNFGTIAQKSWVACRYFLGSTIQTLITAKIGPNCPNFHPLRECVRMASEMRYP